MTLTEAQNLKGSNYDDVDGFYILYYNYLVRVVQYLFVQYHRTVL